MLMLKSAFVTREDGLESSRGPARGMQYWIEEEGENATFFPGHAASVHVKVGGQEQVIGVFGIVHPTVLDKFELRYPVSTLELNVEVFL